MKPFKTIERSANDYVFAIDSTTNSISGSPILVGYRPHNIIYDSINGKLYVTSWGTNNASVISTTPRLQESPAICPERNIQHWDKIVFSISDPEVAQRLNLTANSELDIKVLDDPLDVADIKQKVLDFLHLPMSLNQTIDILDVSYAIVCTEKPDRHQPLNLENSSSIESASITTGLIPQSSVTPYTNMTGPLTNLAPLSPPSNKTINFTETN